MDVNVNTDTKDQSTDAFTVKSMNDTDSEHKDNLVADSLYYAGKEGQIEQFDQSTDDEYNISKFRKWFYLSIVAMQGFLGPLSSSIYVPAVLEVRSDFKTTTTLVNTTISLYILALGIAPLVWAPLSERHGRRMIYIAATVIYVGSTIGCALSPNIGVFIALRITQSAGASAAQAVGAGTITDIFSANERGSAMGLFFLGPLIGPVLGPLVGGYINQYFGWRMIFWILTAMGGLVLIFIVLFLPETSRKHIMAHKKKQTSTAEETVGTLTSELTIAVPEKPTSKAVDPTYENFAVGLVRPLKFLMKPVVILSSLPYALAFGFMYFIISTLPHQLEYKYNFNTGQIGLAYLSNGIGNAMGAVFGGQYSDWFVARQVRKSPDGLKTPEMRIGAMWIGIAMIPLGDLVYGWCLQDRTSVWLVLFGFFITGLGVGMVQTPSNTYLVDAYQNYSASVVSASNLMRCTWAACTPLFAPMFIAAVGNGIALTVVAIISALSGICVLVVQRHGQAMRAKDRRL